MEQDQKVTKSVLDRRAGPTAQSNLILFIPVSIVPELMILPAGLRVTGQECLRVSSGLSELVLRQS